MPVPDHYNNAIKHWASSITQVVHETFMSMVMKESPMNFKRLIFLVSFVLLQVIHHKNDECTKEFINSKAKEQNSDTMDKTDIMLKLLAKTYSSDQIHDQVPFQILIDMYLKVAQSPLFLFY